jgi:hypothetical protein
MADHRRRAVLQNKQTFPTNLPCHSSDPAVLGCSKPGQLEPKVEFEEGYSPRNQALVKTRFASHEPKMTVTRTRRIYTRRSAAIIESVIATLDAAKAHSGRTKTTFVKPSRRTLRTQSISRARVMDSKMGDRCGLGRRGSGRRGKSMRIEIQPEA